MKIAIAKKTVEFYDWLNVTEIYGSEEIAQAFKDSASINPDWPNWGNYFVEMDIELAKTFNKGMYATIREFYVAGQVRELLKIWISPTAFNLFLQIYRIEPAYVHELFG
jgi:hypothetical protein